VERKTLHERTLPHTGRALRHTCDRIKESAVRLLAIGLGIAVLVFVLTAGHVIFLPLLFLPLGLFSLGHRRRRQPGMLSRRDDWSP
jgi:hypothetical protein